MSLYIDAAGVLQDVHHTSVTLKDRVYKDPTLKSSPGAVFALVIETIKWSAVLSEVIDKSQLLSLERKLTPSLALVLVHDLLVSKNGLALSKKHALYDTVTNHKARLSSELTRVRVRRGAPSIEALRALVNAVVEDDRLGDDCSDAAFYPRWVRVNLLRTSFTDVIADEFEDYEPVNYLADLRANVNGIFHDIHVPNLLAIHPSKDITRSKAYMNGSIILQDKASCFPAYLLDPCPVDGRVIDGCAAPGNKTTHVAGILHEKYPGKAVQDLGQRIVACERSKPRAQILERMIRKARAESVVTVRAGQDFLALNPVAEEWLDVGSILLDPSCSGSGIVGRDAVSSGGGDYSSNITFPADPRLQPLQGTSANQSKKRKRKTNEPEKKQVAVAGNEIEVPEAAEQEVDAPSEHDGEKLKERLRALSTFQLKLLTHAFRFPNVKRISYSTCSVHAEENEEVVVSALASDVAAERGWRILRRGTQVEGLRKWKRRGDVDATTAAMTSIAGAVVAVTAREVADACIRCVKGTDEGTMGFFVAGFVRDAFPGAAVDGRGGVDELSAAESVADSEEWGGISDAT